MSRQRFIWVSPVIVVAISAITIRVAAAAYGVEAWLPWILVYWASLAAILAGAGGRARVAGWLKRPEGHWLWSVLPPAVGLSALTVFVGSWQLLTPVRIWLPWLIVALVNPLLEEGYWRGLLLDATATWTNWLRIPYISLFFALNHLLGIGFTSIGCRYPTLIINTFVVGVLFSLVYLKTKSLRWVIAGHFLMDVFGLSVPVFLNLWVPPG